MDTDHPDAVYW